jgi:hypothetical protein
MQTVELAIDSNYNAIKQARRFERRSNPTIVQMKLFYS